MKVLLNIGGREALVVWTLAEQGAAVVNAALSGTIPPDIGAQLITALSNQAKIVEIDELVKRVEALENKN